MGSGRKSAFKQALRPLTKNLCPVGPKKVPVLLGFPSVTSTAKAQAEYLDWRPLLRMQRPMRAGAGR